MEDELESLRQKTARTTDVYEEIEEPSGGGVRGFMNGLSAGQRLLLALLLLLDVVVVAVGLLMLSGRLAF